MTSLKVKIGTSLRRITFTGDEGSSLENVTRQLVEMYRDGLPPIFKLVYRDDEDDMITLASEEEFEEALRICGENVLKLEVEAVPREIPGITFSKAKYIRTGADSASSSTNVSSTSNMVSDSNTTGPISTSSLDASSSGQSNLSHEDSNTSSTTSSDPVDESNSTTGAEKSNSKRSFGPVVISEKHSDGDEVVSAEEREARLEYFRRGKSNDRARERIEQEYREYEKEFEEGDDMSYCIWKSEEDPFKWGAVIFGPAGSPYEGGSFHVDIHFSPQYPAKPPQLTMKTRIYHPCIQANRRHPNFGQILLDLAWSGEGGLYKPTTEMREILRGLVQILVDPHISFWNTADRDIANEFLDHHESYVRRAREWTLKYAIGE